MVSWAPFLSDPRHTILSRAPCLSEGGAYIHTDDVYDVGAYLNLAVEFPECTFRLRGEVVWVKQIPTTSATISSHRRSDASRTPSSTT